MTDVESLCKTLAERIAQVQPLSAKLADDLHALSRSFDAPTRLEQTVIFAEAQAVNTGFCDILMMYSQLQYYQSLTINALCAELASHTVAHKPEGVTLQ